MPNDFHWSWPSTKIYIVLSRYVVRDIPFQVLSTIPSRRHVRSSTKSAVWNPWTCPDSSIRETQFSRSPPLAPTSRTDSPSTHPPSFPHLSPDASKPRSTSLSLVSLLLFTTKICKGFRRLDNALLLERYTTTEMKEMCVRWRVALNVFLMIVKIRWRLRRLERFILWLKGSKT